MAKVFRAYTLATILGCLGALPACDGETRAGAKPDAGGQTRSDAAIEPTVPEAAVTPDSPVGPVGPSLPDVAVVPPLPDVTVVPEVCTGRLPVVTAMDLTTGTESAADWSCYRDESDAGADAGPPGPSSVTFGLNPMVSSFFEGVTVDLFWGTSTLGEPALTRAFQAGAVTFDTPPGVTMFAARVNPAEGTIPGLSVLEEREYGFPVQPGKTSIEGSFILRDSLALSVDLATSGGKADPEKALITALALDCRGLQLRGAQYELIDGESGEPVPVGTSPGQPRPSYVQYGLPSTTCEYTSPGTSAWMLIDAPVNVTNGAKTHAYRVRLKGRKTESDAAPVIIGEREVELFPGILSYVQVHRLTSSER